MGKLWGVGMVIFWVIGMIWTALTITWAVLAVANIIRGTDYHHEVISGLLTCILANQAFERAGRSE